MSKISLTFDSLKQAYLDGAWTVEVLIRHLNEVIESRGEDSVWISRVAKETILERARALDDLSVDEKSVLPLFGVPFSVKDCIDVAGLPTTSACPTYQYIAKRTNRAVQRALDAGAILIGKTNMDQFATGVVGVRTPYGVAQNPFNADYIPGGSSSGAAVSVAAGLCAFAFGSDTGGSGRVPASYNNIIGLKPTLGLLSRTDMVNASVHFDTVSIYALTVCDAADVLRLSQAVDDRDVYGREAPIEVTIRKAQNLRIAIPSAKDLEFFGNEEAEGLFRQGVEALATLGHTMHEINFEKFVETSQMMFEGAWLSERYAAVGGFIDTYPDDIDPIVKKVIDSSKNFSAADAFNAIYQLDRNVRHIQRTFDHADVIAVPTVGTVYRVDEVAADPLFTNATNGRYMNFVNMADLCAIAVPNGFTAKGIPMGITLVAPAFSDFFLCDIAKEFHSLRVKTLGATEFPVQRETT
ncbi:MAG: allophanate hydrolase [Pseudomonadota bacterium]|nr:allophanate hydrolase [Pseudomonadota bacterium]